MTDFTKKKAVIINLPLYRQIAKRKEIDKERMVLLSELANINAMAKRMQRHLENRLSIVKAFNKPINHLVIVKNGGK